jgi:hypothetical protein
MKSKEKSNPKKQEARQAVRRFFEAADRAVQTARELEKARSELEALSATKREAAR